MATIYLKQGEESVCTLRGPNPQMSYWMREHGWEQIDAKEFRRLKAKIKQHPSITRQAISVNSDGETEVRRQDGILRYLP
jgi:hypothetical protein